MAEVWALLSAILVVNILWLITNTSSETALRSETMSDSVEVPPSWVEVRSTPKELRFQWLNLITTPNGLSITANVENLHRYSFS